MTILTDIAAYKRKEIAEAKEHVSFREIERRAREADPPRGFCAMLETKRAAGQYGLIAEIKKASPSKGLIRADYRSARARPCLRTGWSGLSFHPHRYAIVSGRAGNIWLAARAAAKLPVLRKDFMFEPYQVAEARAWGADCTLVIMASVNDAEAHALMKAAREWKIDTLVEVHNEAELDRALALDAQMIGINNRDLNTFVTDLAVTLQLAPRVPKDRLVIAESGLSTPPTSSGWPTRASPPS